MSRSERYSTKREIMKELHAVNGRSTAGGPILYVDHGVKFDDISEKHIKVVGNTGMGKSNCVTIPYARNVIDAEESGIFVDPKGEICRKTYFKAKKTHRVYIWNLRNPGTSQDGIDMLLLAAQKLASEDITERDEGRATIRAFMSGVFPVENATDPFWPQSASRFISGLIYSLFELAPAEKVNLNSVARMLEQAEIRCGVGTLLKELYEKLPDTSLAKRDLAAYATAPNDTRGSIHSVAANGFSVFSNSEGLMDMLCNDTVDLYYFDVTTPFVVYIILPDEDDVYDFIAGTMVSMFTQHLIKMAQNKFDGRLPIRVNVILEEIGSIGKAIPNLPNLISASRSRNMRIMVCLQADEQLVDIYGKAKARTINACFGITVAFSTNDQSMLKEWSERLGKRRIEHEGQVREEYLATPNQIEAMPVGMALIFIGNRIKYFTKLPFYDEMYDLSELEEPPTKSVNKLREIPTFDLKEAVTITRRNREREQRGAAFLNTDRSSFGRTGAFGEDWMTD